MERIGNQSKRSGVEANWILSWLKGLLVVWLRVAFAT
jgi:hypothetical protein